MICDSTTEGGNRVSTLRLRYPRPIHGEFMTHRMFSRNASSSRAIPVKKLIQDVLDDPFVPLVWGKNQKGMQADEECNEGVWDFDPQYAGRELTREDAWHMAMQNAVAAAKAFDVAGYHKQIVNRLLEPFSHINVVVTANQWTNFLSLRDHKDAEPHIAILARDIKAALAASTPRLLYPGDWHLPWVSDEDYDRLWESQLTDGEALAEAKKLSVARCASVSYKTVEGFDMTQERASSLYDKLVAGVPLHASPLEHQCTPDEWLKSGDYGAGHWLGGQHLHGNLPGFIQLRKTLPNENIMELAA